MSISRRAELEIRRMEAHAKFPYLIHIHNDDYGDFYYANSDSEVTLDGHTYSPAWFELSPPERTESTVGNASLSISALPDSDGSSWIEKIRGTDKRSSMDIVGSVVYDNGGAEAEPCEEMSFTLAGVTWNDDVIKWQMEFDDIMDILVPCDICTAMVTPGCA